MDEATLQEILDDAGEPPGAFAEHYRVPALVAEVRRLRALIERAKVEAPL